LEQDFDHIAHEYDKGFTNTLIGAEQRKQVWKHLVPLQKGLKCLELNCGTGEDAKRLCEMGCEVDATDISSEMLLVTQQKISRLGGRTFQLNINDLSPAHVNNKQLIFSNFGGLNCISPTDWKELALTLRHLPNHARIVLVIMGRKCLWERCYFRIKPKNSWSRRNKEAVMANVEGVKVKTWYYSPSQIKDFLKDFKFVKSRPIGFFVPPSYLENFFTKRSGLFRLLALLDQLVGQMAFLANYSDHFYIEFRKE